MPEPSTYIIAPVASPDLQRDKGHIWATSLQIAEHFGKLHKNVIRAIQRLEVSEEFSRLNLEPRDYVDERGKVQPMYHITRDGFVFLAMGFTGKEAARWKEAYITAFNAMEAKLRALYMAPLLEDAPLRRKATMGQLLKLREQSRDQMRVLIQATTQKEKRNLYWELLRINSALGIPTESMESLGIEPLGPEGDMF